MTMRYNFLFGFMSWCQGLIGVQPSKGAGLLFLATTNGAYSSSLRVSGTVDCTVRLPWADRCADDAAIEAKKTKICALPYQKFLMIWRSW